MSATVITFYSYKGGVGRTQALANVAVVLANEGYRVIVVDFDLESPGLHAFFSPVDTPSRRFSDEDLARGTGILEFLAACQEQPSEAPDIAGRLVRCSHEALLPERGSLHLLPSGRLDASYPTRISAFSWEHFYDSGRGAECMEYLREQLCAADADFVLVDSRTGVTDVGSVCTFQLPDLIVVLFALHRQGIDGARRVGAAVAESRTRLGNAGVGERRRNVLFLPTRVIEEDSSERRDEWIAATTDALHPYGRVLFRTGERIPHSLQVAYGEQIVTFPQSDDHLSVAYRGLAKILLSESGKSAAVEAQLVEVAATPRPSDVREQLKQVRQHFALLCDEFGHMSPDSSMLSSVLGWAQRLVQIPLRLSGALDRLDRMVERMLGSFSEPVVLPARSRPDTLRDWREIVESYERFVEQSIGIYNQAIIADVRRRFLKAADEDAQAVALWWPEVQRILNEEPHIDELSARLLPFEQKLHQGSLRILLSHNSLEQSNFDRRRYTPIVAQRWLDERLEKLEEDVNLEPARHKVILNLLRLRAASPSTEPFTAIHWTRYDFLCLDVEQEHKKDPAALQRSDEAYFKQIGQYLWRTAWEVCFSVKPGEPLTFEPPAGASCRAQLTRLQQEELNLVAHTCARGLVKHASHGAWSSVEQLLSAQQRDPILHRALHIMVTADPAVRRRLLALWLCDTHPALEVPLFADYLHTLIVQDEAPQALVALSSLLGETHEIDQGDERRLFDEVYVVGTIALIKGGRIAAVEPLLNDPTFLGRLELIQAGRLLIEILAAGFCPECPPMTDLGTALRRHVRFHHDVFVDGLSDVIDRHLADLDRGLSISPMRAGELQELVDAARAATSPHLFGNQHFQRKFQPFFEEKLDALLDDRRPQAAILEDLERLNADVWVNETLRLLIEVGKTPRNRPPDERERRAFVLSFNAARDCLKKLARHCASTGHLPLSQQVAAATKATEARQALCQVLANSPPDPMLNAVQRLL